MAPAIQPYLEKLSELVYDKIEKYFIQNKDDYKLVGEHFTNRVYQPKDTRKHFEKFQEFYFRTLKKENLSLKEFRERYSILGLSKSDIKIFESKKNNIISLAKQQNRLSELYFSYFTFDNKQLGSFFTKIVHTFQPDDYCPIDNPIRAYFNLDRESYFVSIIVISNAFKKWAEKNSLRIKNIKKHLKQADNIKLLQHDKLTNMKLLNLIFWSVAEMEISSTSKKKKKDNPNISYS